MFTEPRATAEELNIQFSSVLSNEETENIPVVDPGGNPIPTIATITTSNTITSLFPGCSY